MKKVKLAILSEKQVTLSKPDENGLFPERTVLQCLNKADQFEVWADVAPTEAQELAIVTIYDAGEDVPWGETGDKFESQFIQFNGYSSIRRLQAGVALAKLEDAMTVE